MSPGYHFFASTGYLLLVGWLNEIFVTWRTKAPYLAGGTLRVHLLMLA